ncbi:glutamate--tRNA ligase [Oceanomicrobium pacificus]|uniref:Glutamate--tRNA ligase n=1 Tax=Oceanomicrobium pacificus TaxID=2692916 RepID=A0A6B0TJI2_9RHOB|nr:glutamate--tRNA ligase [Oceanomicrobium pacificus]MXU64640.1 glutamate--tRNA ligase [Oceanomicrobium pacificus]
MTTTRFAPSPTGYLHVGNLRAALFNALIARKAPGGRFILRLDDTDPERSTDAFKDAIREDLRWLGLDWDEEVIQSDRLDRYAAAADRLRADGRLYECFETPVELDLKRKKQLAMGKPPVYDRAALALSDAEKDALRAERPSHWRFKLDHDRIEWDDAILGPQSVDAASLSDPVLIRGDGQVLYTLASVVDDSELGITDVVRGADHVTNTATQIQIMDALGATPPRFAHHSLLTGPGGEALSKRLGTLALRDLRAAGVEPMALLSLMARLGSSDPVDLQTELAALADGFDLSRFGAAPTKLDPDDLPALSARLLHQLPLTAVADDLARAGVPDDLAAPFWDAIGENVATRAEIADWWALCRDGTAPVVADEDRDFVATALTLLPEQPWTEATWSDWTGAVKAATGRKGKGLFLPLRRALTGRDHGPDMRKLMPLLMAPPQQAG